MVSFCGSGQWTEQVVIDTIFEVHADAVAFKGDLSKREAHAHVLEQARALFDGQRNWVSSLESPECMQRG